MRLLFFDWGAYTYGDIAQTLHEMNISFRTVSYCFSDKNEDEFFEYRFGKELDEGKFDAVFSVNFFPLVAKCCYSRNIIYLSWSYDNPLNVIDIEKTLGFSTNRVFLFDKAQAAYYKGLGFDNIYHLPLAVNVKRLSGIKPTKEEIARYSAEVSFVGKLYDSDYQFLRAVFNDYQKGYAEGLVNVQKELYGAYLFDDAVTSEFVQAVSNRYKEVTDNPDAAVLKEAITYALSAETTRRERLLLLAMLGKYFDVKLYSREQNELLKNVKFMGSCGYLHEMPVIFKCSKINLNNTLKCLQTGIPLRVLDIIGSGGFVLTNYQEEIAEWFGEAGIVMYENTGDAVEKAEYYLKNEGRRLQIVSDCRNYAEAEFSYHKRISSILDSLFSTQ